MELTELATRCPAWPFGVRLVAERADLLRWVRSHLAYTFESCDLPPDEPDVEIRIRPGRAGIAEAARWLDAGPSTVVEGFRGQYWRMLATPERSVWHRADPTGGAVAVVREAAGWQIRAGDERSAAVAAVRLFRELHRASLAARGAVLLHSSLVVEPELGGLLFLGPKGAGKTTLGLGVAQHGGYAVSSDLTFVLNGRDGRVLGAAVPDTNRVAAGTLGRLTARSGVPDVPLVRGRLAEADGNPPSEKRWMTVLETETLHTIASAPVAGVDTLVVTVPEPGLPEPSVQTLDARAAMPFLRAEFRPPDHLFAGYWLEPGRVVAHAGFDDLVRMVAGLRFRRLRWDPAAHGIDEVLSALQRRNS
ncbi:MAG TPA: hypothetical protein VL551_33715 [Actinospica sp.]|nr:hypothetical protein [Actinospica sp.]